MLPSHGYNLGQPGMPQQTMGQGDPHQHTMPGIPNAEQARTWQQMTQMQNHMQSLRSQGVADMSGGQGNASQNVLELIRNRNLQHQQQQQQMQHAHPQQAFGLSGQMNGVQGGPAMPNQGAHNFQYGQFNNGTRLDPMQQALASRANSNPNMLQMPSNPQDFARQLNLLAHTPNASGLAAFRQLQQQQQQQQQQHQQPQHQQNQHQQMQPAMNNQLNANLNQNGFFPANMAQSDMSSLLHNNVPNRRPQMLGGLPMAQGQNSSPVAAVTARATVLQHELRELQAKEQLIISKRATNPELQADLPQIQKMMQDRREAMQKCVGILQQLNSQQRGAMNPNMPQVGPQGGHNPAHWPGAASNPLANPHMPPNGVMPPNTPLQQNAMSLNTPGSLPPHAMHPQAPPRTIPTPLQMNAAQHHNSPNMGPSGVNPQLNNHSALPAGPSQPGGQPPLQRPGGPAQNQLPALPFDAFNAAYHQWCLKQNITPDEKMMHIDGKKINLHRLHQEVIAAGTFQKIANNIEMWEIIGARMEWNQFPGANGEPAKAGPGVAQRLLHVYKTYLATFDNTYLRSVLVKRFGNQLNGQANQAPNPGPTPPSAPGGPGIPSHHPNPNMTPHQQSLLQLQQNLASLTNISDPQVLMQLIGLSAFPAEELRRRGIQNNVIVTVETHRALLQRAHQARNMLQQQQQQAQQQQQQQQQQLQQQQANQQPQQQQQQQQQLQQQQQHQNDNANQLRHPQQPVVPGGPAPGMSQQAPQGPNPPGFSQTRPNQPNANQLRMALINVQNIRNRVLQLLPSSPPVIVHDSQMQEYQQSFEQLFKLVHDFESRVQLFACLAGEQVVKKVVEIMTQTQFQRQLLSTQNPKYIMDLGTVRTYLQNLQTLIKNLYQRGVQFPTDQARPPSRPPSMQPQPFSPPQAPMMPEPPSHPPVPSAQPSGVPTPQMAHASPRTAPKKKPAIAAEASASSSTPPASASTPANPPTPGRAADSPQTPKSPKAKVAPKPKPKRKMSSVKGPPTTSTAPPSTPAAAATPSADQPSPAHAPTPESAGTKRKREEEPVVIPPPSGDASPSKKVKTEWEGPPSEELARKKQEVEAAGQSDNDAAKFYENMAEMLVMASDSNQVPPEVSDTLDQILNGLSDSVPISSSFDGLGRPASPLPSLGGDVFSEFFDFASFGTEDPSKANTPELIAPTSTNPSPGSGSEPEVAHASTTYVDSARIVDRDDDLDGSDALRLGFWKEIDGGEAAYYNSSDNWKWEGSMAAPDQAWAISSTER